MARQPTIRPQLEEREMRQRAFIIKISASIGAVIAAMSMASPQVTQAAGVTIVVDADNPATNCGSYTAKPSYPDPAAAVSGAASGTTIIICPGNYSISGGISISDKS